MKKVMYWIMKAATCFAMVATVSSVNAACILICHQPKVPQAANRFKR